MNEVPYPIQEYAFIKKKSTISTSDGKKFAFAATEGHLFERRNIEESFVEGAARGFAVASPAHAAYAANGKRVPVPAAYAVLELHARRHGNVGIGKQRQIATEIAVPRRPTPRQRPVAALQSQQHWNAPRTVSFAVDHRRTVPQHLKSQLNKI